MRRTIEVDMSPAAIDQRLRDVSQLRKLGLSLLGARYLGKVQDLGAERFGTRGRDAGSTDAGVPPAAGPADGHD